MAALDVDDNGVPTSAQSGDPGDPTTQTSTEWFQVNMTVDGGDEAQGAIADAAVTDPSSSGTLVALIKGLLTFLRVSAGGLGKAEDAAHASGDTGLMPLAVRKDTAAVSSGTDGDYEPLQTDATGLLRVATKDEEADASNSSSSALEASRVVKASAGKLWGFQGHISDTAPTDIYFITVHDATTATGAPEFSIAVDHTTDTPSTFSFEAGKKGRAHSTGISLGLSTTETTYTSGGSYMWVDAQYD